MPKKYKKGKQYRKSYRRGGAQYRAAAPTRRSAPGAGCIKIVKGRNKIRIWNNCGHDIVLPANGSLALEIVNIVRYELDYGSAVAIFAELLREYTDNRAREKEDIDDYKDWVWAI